MTPVLEQLKFLAKTLPLELFALVGSFIEEIFSPIPSPLILMTAGSLAGARGYPALYILVLAAFASVGKTLAAYLFYLAAAYAEKFLVKKFGRYIGVTQPDIDNISSYFNGTYKDDILLFLARAIPPVPTTIVSVACGLLKINQTTFIRSTFLGYFFRSLAFLFLGHSGYSSYENFSLQNSGMEVYSQVGLFILLSLLMLWVFTPGGRRLLCRLLPPRPPKTSP